MEYSKIHNYRHADPEKVLHVWDALTAGKNQRPVVPTDKLVKSLRKKFSLKDEQIRLLLDEVEGDGLIEKFSCTVSRTGPTGYRLPNFSKSCSRGEHDWYCFQCHKPGEVLRCSDCFRSYHPDCAQEASKISSPGKSLRSPTMMHDGFSDNTFSCAVCESRPKCEFSRKQIRKLLEFATHQLRKQPLWKTFLHIGYADQICKNEYLVYKYNDLDVLQRKIKDGRYAALEEFSMDIQLLVHNVCILHGSYSSHADEVRFFFRSVNTELTEIQLCTDCYINAKTKLSDWISKPCKPPHELIWARNRTTAGAGLFSGTDITQYYWPAKILLERDDTYEIRFFGGTHERASVKKSSTQPFHLPADEIGVLHRSSLPGSLAGGGFEKAWSEVTKLQAHIDSGYYTHSSGESDLPPSDDDYSDELYIAPRRGNLTHCPRMNQADSPRSSSTSNPPIHAKRKRRASSSSQPSSTSTTPTNDLPSPIHVASRSRSPPARTSNRGRRSYARVVSNFIDASNSDGTRRIQASISKLPQVQPGTPGAAAISVLAETKAAMAAAVGNSRLGGPYTSELFKLTSKHTAPMSDNQTSGSYRGGGSTRSRRGRASRLPRTSQRSGQIRKSITSPSRSHTSHHSPSSSSSSSDADSNAADRLPHTSPSVVSDSDSSYGAQRPSSQKHSSKGLRRGRGRGQTTPKPTRSTPSNADAANDRWLEAQRQPARSITSPMRGVSGGSKPRSTSEKLSSLRSPKDSRSLGSPLSSSGGSSSRKKQRRNSSSSKNNPWEDHEDDDELTDRCGSPVDSPDRSNTRQKCITNTANKLSSPRKRVAAAPAMLSTSTRKYSPSKSVSIKRSPLSSNGSPYSSVSTSDAADSDSGFANRRTSTENKVEEERKIRSPKRTSGSLNKEARLYGTSSTMLRRPPFAPPITMSNHHPTGSPNSPHRGHNHHSSTLFHNQSDYASGNSSNTGMGSDTNPSAVLLNDTASHLGNITCAIGPLTNSSSGLPRSHLPPNKRAAAAATAAALIGNGISSPSDHLATAVVGSHISPRNCSSGTNLLPEFIPKKVAHKHVQTTATTCSECKSREVERLELIASHKKALQDLEERLTTQFNEEKEAAIQVALEQAQTNMRDAMEHEHKLALEAADARFTEVLQQTKRRQWCRNCLTEAIYHCCWNTSYCSIPCQQEHWQTEHKRQCRRKR